MNVADFKKLMGSLMAATGYKPDNVDTVEVWRRYLHDVPDDVIRAAFSRACCECKAFPSVALIREYAADAQHGTPSPVPDVWPKVLEAIRYFGFYGKADARAAIPAIVWKALGGDVGWEHLCEMESDQRATYAAQFRQRYGELREREQRDRRLPESLRPRIDNTPVRGLPESAPQPLALPAPAQPTAEQVDAAAMKLRVFRSAEPVEANDADIEANRRRQIEVAKRMAGLA